MYVALPRGILSSFINAWLNAARTRFMGTASIPGDLNLFVSLFTLVRLESQLRDRSLCVYGLGV